MADQPDSPFMILWKEVEALKAEQQRILVHIGLREPDPIPEPEPPYVSPLRAED
jgi:hypothetical protein